MNMTGAGRSGGTDTAAIGRIAAAASAVWRDGGPAAVTFGAVAAEARLAKSLVSHHFPTREQLLEQAAAGLVQDMERQLGRLARQLERLPAGLACPVETAALIVEALATSPSAHGAGLLEFASLGLDAPLYRDVFLRLVGKIQDMLPGDPAHPQRTYLAAFVLGELLGHCPRHGGGPGLAGLRRRIGWLLDDAPSDEQVWLARLISAIAASGAQGALQDAPAEPPPGAAQDSPGNAPAPPASRTGALRGSATRRAAIIGATLDMLAESDAADITHRSIAERAGLPLAATTYHFASKLAILEAAYQQIIDAALAEAQRIADEGARQGGAAFERVLVGMLNFYAGRGRRNAIAQFHLALFACRTETLSEFASKAYDAEVELLRAQAFDSGLPMTRNLAQAVTSLVGGVLLLRILGAAP